MIVHIDSRTPEITVLFFFFFFNDTATTEIYTLSLHDAFRPERGCTVWRQRDTASRRRPSGNRFRALFTRSKTAPAASPRACRSTAMPPPTGEGKVSPINHAASDSRCEVDDSIITPPLPLSPAGLCSPKIGARSARAYPEQLPRRA